MTSHNLSIVFGPSLLRPEHPPTDLAENVRILEKSNQIVTLLIEQFDFIFRRKPVCLHLTS